ncbi:heme-containing dehydratase family protein (plasmid) [Ochrobactrum quorumnocens]|uniref:Heme-containing dehydratase family protein n=1 Tax=Ochrobactrum quorumnocens TaxID=271865 RepID=A0A248UNJ0_9HYPH|nr:phenylacetaldoxime dehydratase family protein [[Ochrobactrum] quorumnocens]ASV88120.1 heme-containing dehydratase family protein [[Ochrobactrum] quorumnocens]
MVFHIKYDRTIAPRKPDCHNPAAPRYALRWEQPVSAIISDYFAMQQNGLPLGRETDFFNFARESFADEDGPDTYEVMRATDELGDTNAVIVGYWVDAVRHARFCLRSELTAWFKSDARLAETSGVWRETISVPYDRHETIYSENWYRIGIGRTAGSTIVPITTNGYFGAARDRIPLSAIDPLNTPCSAPLQQPKETESKGKRIQIRAPLNMVTLRSGQYWAHAHQEQLEDYTQNMRPRLMTGMSYLLDNKQKTGTLALRILTNLNEDGSEKRETSVLAHFISMEHLESWAASHKTHLDIYKHAIAMNRKFKQEREFVSWHELFVNQSASFEYVNCNPTTGLLPFASLEGFDGTVATPLTKAVG